MIDQSTYTAKDALDMINAGIAPLDFENGVAVYRAAVRRLAKVSVPSFMTHDLSAIPMTLNFIEAFFDRWSDQPPRSKKERNARSQFKSRLRTIARRLEGAPVVRTTNSWEAFMNALGQVAAERGMDEQTLIPVTSSLRAASVEKGLEPFDLRPDLLLTLIKESGRKRRNSLKKAARIVDEIWAELPEQLRPESPFGTLDMPSRKRKGLPLPARVSEEMENYLAMRVAGTRAEGFKRTITIQAGIKSDESTNTYRQATGWLFDSLCMVGELQPDADIGMTDLARLDWIGKVSFDSLADADTGIGEPQAFPWHPITPETVYNRVSSLISMFSQLDPTFLAQEVELRDPSTSYTEKFTPVKLRETLSRHFNKEMTDAHRTFCRSLILDPDRQRVLLNMHMICWSEACARWTTYYEQGRLEQMQTMNLCILAAILSIVVNIPFRARTVTSLVLEGDRRDLSLPRGKKRIEFHVAPENMKVRKIFDAVLDDTGQSRPRQILDWFITGPRCELLRNPRLLRAENRQPNLLFGGIDRARYNRILTDWSEDIGMRMTTHMFRHALASILINCCDCPIEEAARMLGNTTAVTERQYAFQDLMRRRGETLRKLEGYRAQLTDTHHPGRERKKSI